MVGCNLGLRPHATQGTRLPIKFNALFTIKNKKERFVNGILGSGGWHRVCKIIFSILLAVTVFFTYYLTN